MGICAHTEEEPQEEGSYGLASTRAMGPAQAWWGPKTHTYQNRACQTSAFNQPSNLPPEISRPTRAISSIWLSEST